MFICDLSVGYTIQMVMPVLFCSQILINYATIPVRILCMPMLCVCVIEGKVCSCFCHISGRRCVEIFLNYVYYYAYFVFMC